MREYLFIAAILILIGGLAFVAIRYSLIARRAAENSWQDLVDRLVRLNQENLTLVALDLIREDGRSRDRDWPEMNSEQIWDLVGGMDGLDKVEANCEVFIDIAVYVQLTHPEAIVIAEEFRRNTRHIQWHINRLRAGARNGNLATNFVTYAQRAVASYYLMRKQLIVLCEQTDFAGLEQLRTAV